MSITPKRVAVITNREFISEQIVTALYNVFEIDLYTAVSALHFALQNGEKYNAIISDSDVEAPNGLLLRRTLVKLGYGHIPFILIVSEIDNAQKAKAVQEGVSEIFIVPLEKKALTKRIPFLVENSGVNKVQPKQPAQFKLPLIKRLFDIFFSSLALLLLSPLFIIIAIMIRMESKGKVFYYSLRVGTGYRIFKFYKFRSMFTGADAKLKDLSHLNQYNADKPAPPKTENDVRVLCDLCEQAGTGCRVPLYSDNKIICEILHKQNKNGKMDSAFIKIKDDPRITKVGKFIRNTSIDELPQLWNVLIVDMSIVGNRPLPLYEAEKITTDKYSMRFMAPAGITGLWQVEKRGRGEMSEDERLNLDNNYAKTHSFGNDIKLILRTIPALFQSESV